MNSQSAGAKKNALAKMFESLMGKKRASPKRRASAKKPAAGKRSAKKK